MPRERRVLYLITTDLSARFLRGQLGHLVDHGFRVAVGTRPGDPPAGYDDGVVVHDLPFVREPHPVADARAVVRTIRLIRRERPGIVNASTPKAGLVGTIAAWLCRVPRRVYVVRGLRFETMTGHRRYMLRWLERVSTAAATDVVFNSESLLAVAERERTVRRGKGVVWGAGSGNGIDVDRFDQLPSRTEARAALGIPIDTKVVGFVGRLTRDKGVLDLVDALDALDDDTMLLLVGDYESGDPVPSATQRAIEADPNIVHVPWVGDSRSVYPAMDVLAFPSYREGLPNVPLEAQLCGIPIVAYDSTGTVDAVFPGPPNEIVPTSDVDRLGRSIREHLAADLPAGERRAADWVAERFARSRVWDNLLSAYESAGPSTGRWQ